METVVSDPDVEEAQIVSWFLKGLHNEAMRLSKKRREIYQKELLILNKTNRNIYDDKKFVDLADLLIATNNTQAEAESRIMFQEAFVQLTELQKRVIIETVLDGATEKEIAKRIGITHQAVSRLKKRGIKKLKKYFVPDNPNRQEEKYPGRKIPSTEA